MRLCRTRSRRGRCGVESSGSRCRRGGHSTDARGRRHLCNPTARSSLGDAAGEEPLACPAAVRVFLRPQADLHGSSVAVGTWRGTGEGDAVKKHSRRGSCEPASRRLAAPCPHALAAAGRPCPLATRLTPASAAPGCCLRRLHLLEREAADCPVERLGLVVATMQWQPVWRPAYSWSPHWLRDPSR